MNRAIALGVIASALVLMGTRCYLDWSEVDCAGDTHGMTEEDCRSAKSQRRTVVDDDVTIAVLVDCWEGNRYVKRPWLDCSRDNRGGGTATYRCSSTATHNGYEATVDFAYARSKAEACFRTAKRAPDDAFRKWQDARAERNRLASEAAEDERQRQAEEDNRFLNRYQMCDLPIGYVDFEYDTHEVPNRCDAELRRLQDRDRLPGGGTECDLDPPPDHCGVVAPPPGGDGQTPWEGENE